MQATAVITAAMNSNVHQ